MPKYEPQTEGQPGEKRCPKCRSPRIEPVGEVRMGVGGVTRDMKCVECQHKWTLTLPLPRSDDTGWG